MNCGGDQCINNSLWGFSLQVASAIVLKIVGALFPIAPKTITARFPRQTTEEKPAQNNFSIPPCLCDECKALHNVSANPAAPARRVDNTVSCEELAELFNDDVDIHFPEEILTDILCMLPVRSLLRFQCASKFWKTLISEPNFKMKHFNHAKYNQNSQKVLIGQPCPKDGSILYYSLPLVQMDEDVRLLGFPSNHGRRRYYILCCCDSLALVWVDGDHLLWNPTTKETVLLPNPNPHFRPFDFKYGLGYDSTSDGYKILRVDDNNRCVAAPSEILALKSGSWRKVDKYPRCKSYLLYGMDSLELVHGAFHWVSKDKSFNYFIVAFNISNEAYREIPLPKALLECLRDGSPRFIRYGVSVLGGQLCAYLTYYYDNGEAGTFKLWVMEGYGVKETWTELFTIRKTRLYTTIPKYRFADGEVLLYYKELGDREKRGNHGFMTSKGPFELLSTSRNFLRGFVFTESLISPKLLI